ncbi:hypothetical protein BS78_09G112000 [Paspalum vaginatum]|nr:hypothetical protein BS78_09G112000 [Paspalum vaginatum]
MGAGPVTPPVIVQFDKTEDQGNTPPAITDLCMGKEDSSKVLDTQEKRDARHGSCRLKDVEKQRKGPALTEKNLSSLGRGADGLPCVDEDATLKAMRRASWRNLDGEMSGLQLTDQVLQPAASPPAWQVQSVFVWHCLPPRGRSGGILLGVRANVLDVSLTVEGEFYIKFHFCNRADKFKWIMMAVYGPAQDEFKSAFLTELVRAC